MKRLLLSFCLLSVVLFSCKKDEDTQENKKSIDSELVGDYTAFTTLNGAFVGYVKQYWDLSIKSDGTYKEKLEEKGTNFNGESESIGSVTLSKPEAGVEDEYKKAFDLETLNLKYKIAYGDKSLSGTGYIAFDDDKKGFTFYYTYENTKYYRHYSRKEE